MNSNLGRMLATLAMLAGMALLGARAGAETFEYLTYTPPPGWMAGQGLESRTYEYQDPSAVGAIILFNSRPTQLSPAAVFAEEWGARLSPVVSLQAPVPQFGQDGDIIIASGASRAILQGTPVSAVLLTFVGRGRALSVIAVASERAIQYLEAFFGTMTVMPAAAPSSPVEAQPLHDKRLPGSGPAIAGLYLWQGVEYTYTPDITGRTSGSAGTQMTTYFYLLSDDGRVARGSGLPPVPGGDIRRFDFDGYLRLNPAASGTYRLEGDRVILAMGTETVMARVLADGQIEIGKRKYKRSGDPGHR